MVIFNSLKLLSCRSSSVENEIPRDTLSSGVKCPRKRFTTCPKEVIFSQETLMRCGDPSLQVQGAMVFHMGQSGMPTERPRMDSNSADMMAVVFISFDCPHSHLLHCFVLICNAEVGGCCPVVGFRLRRMAPKFSCVPMRRSKQSALCRPMLVAH